MRFGRISSRPIVIAFWLYAIALFIATHYPRLAIESPINHTDKVIHFVAFGLWTILCGMAMGFHLRPALHPSNARPAARRVPFLWLPAVASLYAIIDESLQAIPALGRTFSLADMAANLIGVLGGTVLILLFRLKIAGPRTA